VDGVITFLDWDGKAGANKPQRAIVQVKSGKVGSPHIRDLIGVLNREKAAVGVYITLEEPSKDMQTEAISAGFYKPNAGKPVPRIQILTISQLLRGAAVELPVADRTFKQAEKVKADPDSPVQTPLL
jgi:site-specific DNA-methyltransferase (adenine-specific)